MKLYFLIIALLVSSCSSFVFTPCDGIGEKADNTKKLFPLEEDYFLHYERFIKDPMSVNYKRMLYHDDTHFVVETGKFKDIIFYNGDSWGTVRALQFFMTDNYKHYFLINCSKGVLIVEADNKRRIKEIKYAIPDNPIENYIDPAAKNQIWRGKIEVDTDEGLFTAYVLELYSYNLYNPVIPDQITVPIPNNPIISRLYFAKGIGIVKIELFKKGEIDPEYIYNLVKIENNGLTKNSQE